VVFVTQIRDKMMWRKKYLWVKFFFNVYKRKRFFEAIENGEGKK